MESPLLKTLGHIDHITLLDYKDWEMFTEKIMVRFTQKRNDPSWNLKSCCFEKQGIQKTNPNKYKNTKK